MILCCGEALIDLLPAEGPTGPRPCPGGALYNSALALGRLGAKAALVSGLSQDDYGAILRAPLEAAGVVLCDPALPLPSALAIVEIDAGQARYRFKIDGSALAQFTPRKAQDYPRAKAALFGGISLAVLPCAEGYEALALGMGPECLVMLDPNIRPSFITDETAYRARLGRLFARADVVKLSHEDLGWLWPEGEDVALAALFAKGPRLVVITEGAKGARAIHREGWQIRAVAPPVEVRDTIGAGDIFNAAFLAELLQDAPEGQHLDAAQVGRALAFAVEWAALSVARDGADPPWRAART